MKHKNFIAVFISSLLVMVFTNLIYAQCPNEIWADEFDGSALDLTKWSYQIGDGCAESICGWGNQELQEYQAENATVSGGQLHITADREQLRGKRYRYTSARLRTINQGDFTYGRFEALIKLPAGAGLWPAFWMLPTDEVYGGWPNSGEIDIMEFVAANPTETLGYMHYGMNGHQQQGTSFPLYNGQFPDGFHEFALEWEANELRWFVDGNLFQVKTDLDIAPEQWVFDQRFHMLLNVAVGGNLGGPVDDSIFPAVMDVEYVRVYDGFKPYITGNRFVEQMAIGETYSIGNVNGNTNVTWTVPNGATITSGQGTPAITVDWSSATGDVIAEVNTACGVETLVMNVDMAPSYVKAYSFENFDEPADVSLLSSDGTLTEVSNPAPNNVNGSALCAEYVRNGSALFDNIAYDVSSIGDANLYVTGENRFYMDVYTAAPIGTEIIIQLESNIATPNNYPDGRHSRYVGSIKESNAWHRVFFSFLDRPDGGVADNAVSTMVILFNSNTNTSDTYYYDNLDSYIQGTGGNQSPSVSITSPADGSSFDDGSLISITANASDSDGSITTVEFFVDGNSIGTDSSTPYSINWTIGMGNYQITAEATDNEGASSTSSIVNVTGNSTGPATLVYVSSIVTGTASAGQGNKYGTANVTILDDLGNPVSNATVTGTFSGTFNETVAANTDNGGVAQLMTSGTAKGSVVVNLCVDDVQTALPYDETQNIITCTGGSSRLLSPTSTNLDAYAHVYPNPTAGAINLVIRLDDVSDINISIMDLNGKTIWQDQLMNFNPGEHLIEYDHVLADPGIYILDVYTNKALYRMKVSKL